MPLSHATSATPRAQARAGPEKLWPTAGPSPAESAERLKAKNRLLRRLASSFERMRSQDRGPPRSRDGGLESGAAASLTKVSKPVLFALKMTDFQHAHKQDSEPPFTHSGAAVI